MRNKKEERIKALEKQQEEALNDLQKVNNEIDLYEEDYRPDLIAQKEAIELNLSKIEKALDKEYDSEF